MVIQQAQYRRTMPNRTPIWKQDARRAMNNRIRVVAVALAVLPGLFALFTLGRKAHQPAAVTVPEGWVACQVMGHGRSSWLEKGRLCHADPADRAPDYIILAPGLTPQSALQQLCGDDHGCNVHLTDVPREPRCPERRGCA